MIDSGVMSGAGYQTGGVGYHTGGVGSSRIEDRWFVILFCNY